MTDDMRAPDPVEAIAALQEPTRRRLYDHVVARDEPVGRDEAADALGIGRPIAAFHLDRLVRAGLLTASFRRLTGRTGPGAGRPAKVYRRAPGTVALSVPARTYDVAADLFATALEAGDPGVLFERARARGRALGQEALDALGAAPSDERREEALVATLREAGYEPRAEGRMLLLRNCPFDALVSEHRPLTCGMNLATLEGLRDGIGETTLEPRPVVIPGYCCVGFTPRE